MAYKEKHHQAYAARDHYLRNKERVKKTAKYYTNSQRKILRRIKTDYLRLHPCVDCGETDVDVLEFDHVRGIKSAEISALVNGAVATETLRAEMDKCEVRCANCHRKVTKARRQYTSKRPVAQGSERFLF